jgi:hypothetical protein
MSDATAFPVPRPGDLRRFADMVNERAGRAVVKVAADDGIRLVGALSNKTIPAGHTLLIIDGYHPTHPTTFFVLSNLETIC